MVTRTLWTGPDGAGPNGGVTQSLLGRWLVCRERARLLTVDGLRPVERFNRRLEYGSMFHVCCEAAASEVSHFGEYVGTTLWRDDLAKYVTGLVTKYKEDVEQIQHWYNVCCVQFPHYLGFWTRHSLSSTTTNLLREHVFDVSYRLPSGRSVRLRGKWDSVDIREGDTDWLTDHKTMGDIDEHAIQRRLRWDLQLMFYLLALGHSEEIGSMPGQLAGVTLDVVRRPLSGGTGSIRQTKSETVGDFYLRLSKVIAENPAHFFMRWDVPVTADHLARFRRETLDPLLEQLCDWWIYVSAPNCEGMGGVFGSQRGLHYRAPYGVWGLDPAGDDAIEDHLADGSTVGLERAEVMFPELEEKT